MTSSTRKRSSWYRTKKGCWTLSLGDRGTRVRLFQRKKDGVFYRGVWRAGMTEDQKSLNTHDKDEAARLGKVLLAELLRGEIKPESRPPLTLGQLWHAFSHGSAEFLDNAARTRSDAERRTTILRGYFGDDFQVEDFTIDDQRRYERARAAGGIKSITGFVTGKTRARSAEADIVQLHTMLRWATTKRVEGKKYLLDRHPLLGVRRVREKNKKQAVATMERFEATMNALRNFVSESEDTPTRLRWLRIEFALFLAEATGRRLGSIRQLRWEDFRYEKNVVHWRAEADKKGYHWEIPMPQSFMDEVRRYQKGMGAITGYVFAAPRAEDGIMDRHLFDQWLREAQNAAGLKDLDGSLWHAYRRKWATERKHLNPKDVAAAGGWKDVATLLEVYQHADESSVLAVMSEPRKLREKGVA